MPGDVDADADLDPALLEGTLHDARHLGVAARKDRRERFEDRDLRAHVGEQGRELAADRPTADHRGPLGQLAEVEELVRGDDDLSVDVEARQAARHRARGEDHVGPPGDDAGVGAVEHAHREVLLEPSGALEDRDLAALQEPRESLEETIHDLALASLADREVHRDPRGLDAKVLRVLDGAVHVGRLQELLGRHAAPMQAGAADLVALDDRDIEPGGRPVEGGRVAAGPSADHDHVELLDLVGHGTTPSL